MKRKAIVLATMLAMLILPACGGEEDATETSPAASSGPVEGSVSGTDGQIVLRAVRPSTVP
jgi:hypothetical protein